MAVKKRKKFKGLKIGISVPNNNQVGVQGSVLSGLQCNFSKI